MANQHQKKISPGCQMNNICAIHGEFKPETIEILGKMRSKGCPECNKDRQKKQEEVIKKSGIAEKRKTFKFSGISKRFLNSTFDNYDQSVSPESEVNFKTIKAYHDNFDKIIDLGSSLILCGKPGTGKTHLVCALAVSLINQKYPVKYTTAYKMLARIKATYSKKAVETKKEAIEKLSTTSLLIIDEVGVQSGSEADLILFYQVINGRYDNVLPTILISNLTKSELTEFIGERCIDRLREGSGVDLYFNWESYRE